MIKITPFVDEDLQGDYEISLLHGDWKHPLDPELLRDARVHGLLLNYHTNMNDAWKLVDEMGSKSNIHISYYENESKNKWHCTAFDEHGDIITERGNTPQKAICRCYRKWKSKAYL